MKHDLGLLLHQVEKKIGLKVNLSSDFDKLAKIFSAHHLHLHPTALKKVWEYITGKEKPSQETLDKIALFAGFQSWQDFREELHGESDGQTNYHAEEDSVK
ncbi:MAG: hypothetical protein MR536_04525 [Prevotella sp.]|nr:hypothetical protein [Prevotella sp.]MDD7461213.1 hypothetical protein [Prevotellaceae bacterium]MDY3366056.1 hypothetical protein [Prevotella sp.]MDY3852330.1 hypothetical protein [Prevotella sp.]